MALAKMKQKPCMNPDCRTHGGKAQFLGLCEACYRALKRLIAKDVLSLDEAVERGLCRQKRPAGSRRFPGVVGAPHFQPTTRKAR